VREIRLLPLSTLFEPYPRVVRDLTKERQKEVDLRIYGENTLVDKRILSAIKDPLIHLIRNAIDHGIETPEERIKIGKPKKGMIKLIARERGDKVVIEVEDDGGGMDPKMIREEAINKGMMKKEDTLALTEEASLNLIFFSGFSTKEITTELSGRGVGLDVVKQNIEATGGSVTVSSTVDKGTTFTLRVPLTLTIIRALVFEAGDETFAIPATSIEEAVKITPDEIQTVEGKEAIRFRDKTIPLVRFPALLNLEGGRIFNNKKAPVIIVNYAEEHIGFLVNSLLGEKEITIKPLGEFLKGLENLAGFTISEDGSVMPLVHVPDLFASAKSLSLGVPKVEPAPKEPARHRRILIVEDSFITRDMERSLLESFGYEVSEAGDGVEALERLREKPFDLIIADLQMPNMDGFELTRRLKSDEKYRDIPIVIVTTLASKEDKIKGLEAGADVYITKSEFRQEDLLDTIERLIH